MSAIDTWQQAAAHHSAAIKTSFAKLGLSASHSSLVAFVLARATHFKHFTLHTIIKPGTAEHQPNKQISSCRICHTSFSFFTRQHHCRYCGQTICDQCSPERMYLPDPDTGEEEKVRVCNHCIFFFKDREMLYQHICLYSINAALIAAYNDGAMIAVELIKKFKLNFEYDCWQDLFDNQHDKTNAWQWLCLHPKIIVRLKETTEALESIIKRLIELASMEQLPTISTILRALKPSVKHECNKLHTTICQRILQQCKQTHPLPANLALELQTVKTDMEFALILGKLSDNIKSNFANLQFDVKQLNVWYYLPFKYLFMHPDFDETYIETFGWPKMWQILLNNPIPLTASDPIDYQTVKIFAVVLQRFPQAEQETIEECINKITGPIKSNFLSAIDEAKRVSAMGNVAANLETMSITTTASALSSDSNSSNGDSSSELSWSQDR